MSELKIGDRVRVVDDPTITRPTGYETMARIEGTVKELNETHVGVEFDYYTDVKNNSWNGRFWHIPYDYLEKIEDTEEVNEETKAETMEQKILKALREEIGVEVGEEFDVCEKGEKQWTCKFEKNGFNRKMNDKFEESGLWKSIMGDFGSYQFKRKPFVPKYCQEYFYLDVENLGGKSLAVDVDVDIWTDKISDYGMLALGNVFRTKEEALKGEDKLLERLNELLKEE